MQEKHWAEWGNIPSTKNVQFSFTEAYIQNYGSILGIFTLC